MAPEEDPDEFGRQVRDALVHLYDPVSLQTHPLVRYVRHPSVHQRRAGEALADALRAAIEATRPPADSAPDSIAWRRYRSLVLRYAETLDAHAVQDELAISQSTYYREHHHALEAVVAILREDWHVTESAEPRGGSHAAAMSSPTFLTSFVGRTAELAQIEQLLEYGRMVTLTGTGGSGKTRLATQIGAHVAERGSGDVCVVELASLTDPALVPSAVAAALGVREEPDHPILETLLGAVHDHRLLIILDNCEHLLDACARLADALLRRCPGVRILATSREALSIAGEVTRRVPPLSVPPLDPLPPIDALRDYEAVRLFVDRAAAVQPAFAVTKQNAAAVARVCARLDGIPLALELAAARLNGLTVGQLAERLDQRFRLLTGGSRTGLPHHQTLRATIDWSYALLTERERLLFDRLSAFGGGWTVEAAEAVGAGNGLDRDDVLALLLRLVDQSLVVADDVENGRRGDVKRYGLLDTLREYAREKLAARGDVEAVYGRHAAYYLALAEKAEPHLLRARQLAWLEHLDAEHDNLRSALRWLWDTGKVHDAARLGGSLHWFWYFRGHAAEERAWLRQILKARGSAGRGAAWAKVFIWAGNAASWDRRDAQAGRALIEEALAMGRELGDDPITALALQTMAGLDRDQGNDITARDQYLESLAIYRRIDDDWGVTMTLNYVGRLRHLLNEYDAARVALDEALELGRVAGDRRALAMALEYRGALATTIGDYVQARADLEEGLDLYCQLGDTIGIAMVHKLLGQLAAAKGDYEAAGNRYRASVSVLRERVHMSDGVWIVESLEGLVIVAVAQGQLDRAVRLAGAAWKLRDVGGIRFQPASRAEVEAALETARRALDDPAVHAAWAEGQATSLEGAIALALDSGAYEMSP